MNGPIQIDIARKESSAHHSSIRSHILHPHEDIVIFCAFHADKENVLSVIEDHMLESISSTEWRRDEEESDFSYVTEKYNHFLSHLAEADLEGTSGIFAVLRDKHLMMSSFGGMRGWIHEYDGRISPIQEDTSNHHRFELISSGDIQIGNTVFLSSRDLIEEAGEGFLSDIAHLAQEDFIKNVGETAEREGIDEIHMIRLSGQKWSPEKKERSSMRTKQSDIIADTIGKVKIQVLGSRLYQKLREQGEIFFSSKNRFFMVGFLTVGIVLFFLLISSLINALFQAGSGSTKDAKNSLLKAKDLIEESQKMTGNEILFSQKMGEATKILDELKGKNLYLKETRELSSRIEAMKKEIYDIQTVDLSTKKSIIAFNPNDISPVGAYEYDKKITLIGKNGMIANYAPGNTLPKVIPYPGGEEVIDYTSTEDGLLIAITKNKRVIATRKNGDINYVTVTGQDGWEGGDKINTFNGNIYITDTNLGQIFKHKPGINGYSQKSEVFPETIKNIKEVGIDGGFYIINGDGKISRIMTAKGYNQVGLTLNKIPGTYTIGQNAGKTSLFLGGNLKYVYILDGNRVWIFEADSKRFQDIKAWTYIAQLEINTPEEIRNIALPRDGMIYVVTNLGVYEVSFELVDHNIILRS